MKIVDKPTYTRHITGELKRFDDRNTGFSRGAVEGDKYTLMHDNSVVNIEKQTAGKTILDHATWVAGRTVDYVVRRNLLGRKISPIYNKKYRLAHPDPLKMTEIIKETARWIGADMVGVAKLNPLWIYTHWGNQNVGDYRIKTFSNRLFKLTKKEEICPGMSILFCRHFLLWDYIFASNG